MRVSDEISKAQPEQFDAGAEESVSIQVVETESEADSLAGIKSDLSEETPPELGGFRPF